MTGTLFGPYRQCIKFNRPLQSAHHCTAREPGLLSYITLLFMFSRRCCVFSYKVGDLNIMLTGVNATTKFQFSQILEVI